MMQRQFYKMINKYVKTFLKEFKVLPFIASFLLDLFFEYARIGKYYERIYNYYYKIITDSEEPVTYNQTDFLDESSIIQNKIYAVFYIYFTLVFNFIQSFFKLDFLGINIDFIIIYNI